MVLDEQRYLREVLEPAATAGDLPPDDLRARYQLGEPLAAEEVRASVQRVRMYWRKARGRLRFRRLVDRLEGEHRRLAPLFDQAVAGDPTPLRNEILTAARAAERRRVEQRARLLDAAGVVRMLTPDDVRRIAGTEADPQATAGIDIRTPDPLPTVPPYPAYARVEDALDALGHRHLLGFLLGDDLPAAVLDDMPEGLAAAVERAGREWAKRPRDGNRVNADTVLAAVRHTDERLAVLIRYDLAARLRRRHRQHASEKALLRFATGELGVADDEARRLVFAVCREDAPAGGLATRLRELIDAGEVHAAARLATAEDTEDTDVRQLALEAHRRVSTADALRAEAADLAGSDSDAAWLRLTEATRLAPDLAGAEDIRRRLAPRPVDSIDAVPGDALVVLTWPPSPSPVGDITYRVVRGIGRAPRHIADGETLDGDRDLRPPVNAPLYYAVFALRGTAVATPAEAGPVYVRPEPEAALTAGDGVVTGRWARPPHALRVVVTRDGVSVTTRGDGFRDRTVRNGIAATYRIAAVYRTEHGEEATTPGVSLTAVPTIRPEPVADLTVEPGPSGGVIATYREPSHGTVELIALTEPPPWPYGATVEAAEVRRTGCTPPARPVPGGVAIDPPTPVLLAVTVSGETATIGAHRDRVNLAAPAELIIGRHGTMVTLGFEWPSGVTEVEVVRRGDDGVMAERRRVGRARYDADGGVRLTVPEDEPTLIEVAAAQPGVPGTGSPVQARLPGRTVVRYALSRPRLRGVVRVTLSARRPVRLRRLVLVAGSGLLPQRVDDGEIVMSWEGLTVTTERPIRLTAPVPRRNGPLWLRCFTDDEAITLRDPPVRLLRIG